MSNTCIGGAHVHRGAFIISIIGILASVVTLCFYLNEPIKAYFHITLTLIAFLCYLGLVVGNNSEHHALYWPFLIVIPVAILAQILNALLIFFIVGVQLSTGRRQIVEDQDLANVYQFVRAHPGLTFDALRPASVLVILLGVAYLVAAFFQCYFYSVIIRAAKYLRKVRHSRSLEEITWTRRVY